MFQLGSVSRARIEASRKPGGAPLPPLHSSRYQPDVEPAIRTGVLAMTHAALELLAKD
jgi:hippurate hydrolase